MFAYPSEFKFQLIFTNLFGTMSFMQHNELENRRCHTVIGVTVFVSATFRSSETDHNVTYKRSTINNNNAAFFFILASHRALFRFAPSMRSKFHETFDFLERFHIFIFFLFLVYNEKQRIESHGPADSIASIIIVTNS